MNTHTGSQHEQTIAILFELSSEESSEEDLALVSALGGDVTSALQSAGVSVRPVEVGTVTRGGNELLVEIIAAVTNAATVAWTYRDVFERVLNDASALITICTGVEPLLRRLFQSHRGRTARQGGLDSQPLKITLEIDGAPLTIEAADVEQAEAALKIAQRFYTEHPETAKRVTGQSRVRVRGRLAGHARRKRR